jgi:hypothetical protein
MNNTLMTVSGQLAERESAMREVTVDATATLVPPRPLADDELSDLIAAVIDHLDTRVLDPSVSTIREEQGVQVEVSVTIDTDGPWRAQALAAAAMQDAFDNAMPAVAGMTRGLVLQATLYRHGNFIGFRFDSRKTETFSSPNRRTPAAYASAVTNTCRLDLDGAVICPDEKTAIWYAEPLPTACTSRKHCCHHASGHH